MGSVLPIPEAGIEVVLEFTVRRNHCCAPESTSGVKSLAGP